MRVVLTAGEFGAALARAGWPIEKRATIPVLGNVMLWAATDGLDISGTDMDIYATSAVGGAVRVEEIGTITAPAATLGAVLKTLPADAELTIETGDAVLAIRGPDVNMEIPTLPASDFPSAQLPKLRVARAVLTMDQLRQLFDRTRYAISTEETRYYLNGMCLETVGAGLRFIATDGHRMAHETVDLSERAAPERAGAFPRAILPKSAVAGIRKLINGKLQGDIEIALYRKDPGGTGWFAFRFGTTSIRSKEIDGTFPDYHRVIPSTFASTVEVPRARFMLAIKRAAAICDERACAVALLPRVEMLAIRSKAAEGSEVYEKMPATITGNAPEIGFNSGYLTDALERFSGETVRFCLGEPSAPAVIVDVGHESNVVVQMPMRI
jgi:DNA polymerase III subunit beta